jgi:hypothetical protein
MGCPVLIFSDIPMDVKHISFIFEKLDRGRFTLSKEKIA